MPAVDAVSESPCDEVVNNQTARTMKTSLIIESDDAVTAATTVDACALIIFSCGIYYPGTFGSVDVQYMNL